MAKKCTIDSVLAGRRDDLCLGLMSPFGQEDYADNQTDCNGSAEAIQSDEE